MYPRLPRSPDLPEWLPLPSNVFDEIQAFADPNAGMQDWNPEDWNMEDWNVEDWNVEDWNVEDWNVEEWDPQAFEDFYQPTSLSNASSSQAWLPTDDDLATLESQFEELNQLYPSLPATDFHPNPYATQSQHEMAVSTTRTQREDPAQAQRRLRRVAREERIDAQCIRCKFRRIEICFACRVLESAPAANVAQCRDGIPGGPCKPCARLKDSHRSFGLPCMRVCLDRVILVRHCKCLSIHGCNHRANRATGHGPFKQMEGQPVEYMWAPRRNGRRLYPLEVTWLLPDGKEVMQLRAMKFKARKVRLPSAISESFAESFAIPDSSLLKQSCNGYFTALESSVEDWLFELVQNDKIATLTFREVVRKRRAYYTIFELVMRLVCLSIISQGGGLGRSEHGFLRGPVSSAMHHQMDVVALQRMKVVEKQCLDLLKSRILSRQRPIRRPWHDVFLVFYVLFWNLDYIRRGAIEKTAFKNDTVKSQIEVWDLSSKVLLGYWVGFLRSFRPFKQARDVSETLRNEGLVEKMKPLDDSEYEYIMQLTDILEQGHVVQSDDNGDLSLADECPEYKGYPAALHTLRSEWITKLLQAGGANVVVYPIDWVGPSS
ncbi:hypothetical protein N0V90_013514 [Kalmusia sp. IMI 367209]|nr:hypothetical protein N0V90_013514 [Kalmusia sp. IMI 367209]